ncbi:MAG TPA: P-type conjugative transfer protein TrbG [Hyphomonas sp.]|nr:P-type conjugative transfer protein TrbG [Hyphomonas sp.]
MIRFLLSASVLTLASACATAPIDDPVLFERAEFQQASLDRTEPPRPVEIVETPEPLPLPGQLKPIEAPPAQKQLSPIAAIAEGRTAARIEPSMDGYMNAIQVYPYTEGALYRLYASPGQVSDIALQPGETLVSVSAGDTVRWVLGDTVSGSGADARSHVLVKPVSAGLATNLMIATDRRTYHLELTSLETSYMAALSWRYPADELERLTSRNAEALARERASIEPALALEGLNFDYRMTGDTPDWKPVRVFDDGRQVFIQMPASIATTDMPPLFVIGEDGKAELVNYRVRGTYYVVDRLFRAAELRLGQKDQTVVRISRVPRRTGLAAIFGG